MTTIDTTGLRTRAQAAARAGDDIHIAPGSFLALLDALDTAEKRGSEEKTLRMKATAATTRAEDRIRHLEETARVTVREALRAERERDEWRQTALDERGAALDALEQIKARDKRIQAVRDVLARWDSPQLRAEQDQHWPAQRRTGHRRMMSAIRRALDQ